MPFTHAVHTAPSKSGGLLWCCAAVAGLEERVGLQRAMLIVPLMYLLSGIGFFFAERIVESEKAAGSSADAAKTSL